MAKRKITQDALNFQAIPRICSSDYTSVYRYSHLKAIPTHEQSLPLIEIRTKNEKQLLDSTLVLSG